MSEKSLSQKIIAMLLSAALVLAFIPSVSYADDEPGSDEGVTSSEQTAAETGSDEATAEAESGDTASEVPSAKDEATASTATQSEEASEEASTGEASSSTAEDEAVEGPANSWRYLNGTLFSSTSGATTDGESVTLSKARGAVDGVATYATWVKSNGQSSYTYKENPWDAGQTISVSGAKRVGIDVSEHQGAIDWAKVKQDGISFAIIRCGYGSDYSSQDDDYFFQNVRGALANDMEIGIYLYSYANSTAKAASEAQHVLRLLRAAGLEPSDLDYPVYYDLEDANTTGKMSKSAIASYATIFCNALSNEGYSVGIYANQYWWNNKLTDAAFSNENWSRWAARYPMSKATSSGVSNTDIWQFSDAGSVNGINGRVDMNFDYVGEYAGSGTATAPASAAVSYQAHVAYTGWQGWFADGNTAGTTGMSRGAEGLRISLGNGLSGSIQYRAHVAYIGWQDWVADGALAGTTGQSKSIEAVQVKLSGDVASRYDVYYRVHSADYGWLGWTKNGESAGTEGLSKQVEAIQIVLVEKGKAPSGYDSSQTAFHKKMITGTAHVADIGWMSTVTNTSLGSTLALGTTGRSKSMEAVQITIPGLSDNAVRYRVHGQYYGWQNWVTSGNTAGTTGQSRRMEAIRIELTGDYANQYDIYYRAHVQDYGWLGWAKNGASAGTEGLSKRLEALDIVVVAKGAAAPGSTSNAFYSN